MRKYFEGLLLLLLAVGFCALASSGHLAAPILVVAGGAFVLRFLLFARDIQPRIPARWLLAALLVYLPVYVFDAFLLSPGFLGATLHALALISALKLFTFGGGRDGLAVGALAFLEVLAAALLTASGLFLAFFLVFFGLLIASLVAYEVLRSQELALRLAPLGGALIETPGQPPRAAPPLRLRRSLLRLSMLLSGAVVACGAAIFFLLPRTTFAGWNPPSDSSALSGFSDDVRLGEVANLQLSDQVILHIRITGSEPPLDARALPPIAWRGRGLTHFDGQRWTSPSQPMLFPTRYGRLQVNDPAPGPAAQLIQYQVTLEPLSSPVLFYPARLIETSTQFPLLAWDAPTATLESVGRSFSGTSYSGISDISPPGADALASLAALPRARPRREFEPFLELPPDLDPRIRALAHAAAPGGSPVDQMMALSRYLRSHYAYSLRNLPQGADPLADFLFGTGSGDCEYFASALAVMARTLGIPTRVVNGFTLGDFNPVSGAYIVRGRDAHSWVEAYFPRAGGRRGTWMSFDATPGTLAEPAGPWSQASFLLDAAASFWQEWMVNYDWLHQSALARGIQSAARADSAAAWRGGRGFAAAAAAEWRRARAAAPALLLPLLALLGWAGWRGHYRGVGWRRRRSPPWAAAHARACYRRLQRALRPLGYRRRPDHTAADLRWALRAAPPPLQHAVGKFLTGYEQLRFGLGEAPAAVCRTRADELTRQLRLARRECRRLTWRRRFGVGAARAAL